jgi:nucleoside-diphosphate-sugar epimerase
MRIFLAGATTYIGWAVLDACLRAGHQVTALVRDARSAAQVKAKGAACVLGDPADGAVWQGIAEKHDGLVHTAYEHSLRGAELDRRALEWVLGSTHGAAAEDQPPAPLEVAAWRTAHEALVLDAAGPALRTAVVRAGIVYGGGRGIVSDLLKAGANGLVRVVGDGRNRWALVYDRDLADLYVRILGEAGAAGIFHANDEGDERVIDIAEAIARSAKTPADIRHIPIEEARAKMGPIAEALAADQVVRSARARAIGWIPGLRSVAGNVPRLMEEWRRAQE